MLLMLDLILEATVLISVATISCFLKKKNIQMLILLQFVLKKKREFVFFLNYLSNIDIHT